MSYESEADRQLNQIKESHKRLCLMTHRDKTDDELRAIIRHNTVAIYSQDGIEGYQTLGESEACVELLEQRQKRASYRESEELHLVGAMDHWEKANDARRKKAILNLPAATSYHGQLVAAVLDDAGHSLTAKEIRQWSDELAAMNNSDYKKLLDDLCNEEVLYRTNNNMYTILSLCTPDLFPTNPRLWMQVHGPHANYYSDSKFLLHLIETGTPATELDWIELQSDAARGFHKSHLEKDPKKTYADIRKSYLRDYLSDRILRATPIPGTDLNYYYFVMLGEKEGE